MHSPTRWAPTIYVAPINILGFFTPIMWSYFTLLIPGFPGPIFEEVAFRPSANRLSNLTLIHIDDLSSTWAQEYRRWRTLHKTFLGCGGWFGTGHKCQGWNMLWWGSDTLWFWVNRQRPWDYRSENITRDAKRRTFSMFNICWQLINIPWHLFTRGLLLFLQQSWKQETSPSQTIGFFTSSLSALPN